jgi:hypothetical protein
MAPIYRPIPLDLEDGWMYRLRFQRIDLCAVRIAARTGTRARRDTAAAQHAFLSLARGSERPMDDSLFCYVHVHALACRVGRT